MTTTQATKLSKVQLNHFESILLEQRKQLLLDIYTDLSNSHDKNHISLAKKVHDRGEEALVEAMDRVNTDIVQMQLRDLNAISHALQQIKKGTYGICCDCENDIDIARLKVNPAAKRCIDCQVDWESMQHLKNISTKRRVGINL